METNLISKELLAKLENQGVDLVKFVDISQLSEAQNKGYSTAILFGIVLSQDYLKKVAANVDYVEQMKINKTIVSDEFHLTELKTDKIADDIEQFIQSKGFKAYSQSEDNIIKTGCYDEENKKTPLPHKTIAGLAGLGWIGKHNLLVTKEYGSAISMCSVLTDVPLESIRMEPMTSKCGDCTVCVEICKVNALKGETWEKGIAREKIVDVFQCTTCFQCVVQCPWTKKYKNENV
ncbi:hypothetical protein SLH46_17245 [Draconibacterium sp. IB214405]|uniref:hypothetical protein n=1 Tax=Draconibacterium sp. IB214405 TaxID=3097352 RepID=UPI002A160850|nr:hypothetical protein [Draconibacterium sp. IB214405]MDX8340948.1 hypothetical protein [Draconibacterium sp. IB214405]